jgi:hypothetical protein
MIFQKTKHGFSTGSGKPVQRSQIAPALNQKLFIL